MIEFVFPMGSGGGGLYADDKCYCGCWCPQGAQPKADDFNDDKNDEIIEGPNT